MSEKKRKRESKKELSKTASSNQSQQQSIPRGSSSENSKKKTTKLPTSDSTSYSIVTRSKSRQNLQTGSTSSSSSSSSSFDSRNERPSKKMKKSPVPTSSDRTSRGKDRKEIERALTAPEKELEKVLGLNTQDLADLIEDEDDQEELVQRSSSSSQAEHIPQQQRGRDLLLVNLDRLAWLLQENTKSCSSVCLINKKLLLSDNHIHQGSQENSKIVEYKKAILDYFTYVAEGIDTGQLKEKRTELLKRILEAKIKGESIGYLKPIGKESKDQIIDILLKSVADNFDEADIRTEKMRQNMINKCEPVLRKVLHAETQFYATVGLCIKTICRRTFSQAAARAR